MPKIHEEMFSDSPIQSAIVSGSLISEFASTLTVVDSTFVVSDAGLVKYFGYSCGIVLKVSSIHKYDQ